MKPSILSIIGARPQFVKAAIISDAMAGIGSADHRIVHTGQHFDVNMSDVFFQELGIPEPDFNLGIAGTTHGAMTGQMLEQLEALFITEKPAVVVVYGDTNSTLAGALAAAKLHIPLAHIEAGMRSYNRMPEEINRVMTDHVSDILFSVTDQSTRNLANEGISGKHVLQVGDVMHDCAIKCASIAERQSTVLTDLGLEKGNFVLSTVHRPVNTDNRDKLECLVRGLDNVAAQLPVVLPIHPRTRARMTEWQLEPQSDNVTLTDPVGYIDMVQLERSAALIVTDSGGVQREAFFHRIPCVTFRDETEWTELVDLNWNILAELNTAEDFASLVLSRIGVQGQDAEPYGDGTTGTQIAKILAEMPGYAYKR